MSMNFHLPFLKIELKQNYKGMQETFELRSFPCYEEPERLPLDFRRYLVLMKVTEENFVTYPCFVDARQKWINSKKEK